MRRRISALAATLTLLVTLAGCATPTGRDYYPDAARRRGLTGRVGVEYSVDEKGHAQNIVVLESGGSLFDAAAMDLISHAHFTGAPNRVATAGAARRYRQGVIFELLNRPKVQRFDDNRQTVVVTARGPGA